VGALLFLAVGAAPLRILYVWQDRPGVTDRGEHTLSGWLVDVFGVRFARPAGMLLFALLSVVLLALLVGYVRWTDQLRREREARCRARRQRASSS
jgi:hypothetical protein